MLIKLGVQGTNVSDITVGRNGAGVISLSRLKDDRMGASEGVNSAKVYVRSVNCPHMA